HGLALGLAKERGDTHGHLGRQGELAIEEIGAAAREKWPESRGQALWREIQKVGQHRSLAEDGDPFLVPGMRDLPLVQALGVEHDGAGRAAHLDRVLRREQYGAPALQPEM